eukprot:6138162-Pyramimonas_sp.AAC.1
MLQCRKFLGPGGSPRRASQKSSTAIMRRYISGPPKRGARTGGRARRDPDRSKFRECTTRALVSTR